MSDAAILAEIERAAATNGDFATAWAILKLVDEVAELTDEIAALRRDLLEYSKPQPAHPQALDVNPLGGEYGAALGITPPGDAP